MGHYASEMGDGGVVYDTPSDYQKKLLKKYFISGGGSAIGGGCNVCGAHVEGSWLSFKYLLIHVYWHERNGFR